MLRLFEQVARPGFGLSSSAVALVRHYVLKTMDGDYLTGRICAVWTQACRFAEALGLTPRSINSAERELEQAGFIVRNAGINGERAGDRQDGAIVWAAGINLAPLVDRFAEMQAKAEALDLQARAIQQCRAEIRQLGQRIRPATALSVATEGYRSVVEALGGPTWPNLVEASWRSCGRLGIAQSTWGQACQQFGRERAALSVLLIDRNFDLPTGHRYRVFQCDHSTKSTLTTHVPNSTVLFWATFWDCPLICSPMAARSSCCDASFRSSRRLPGRNVVRRTDLHS
jgi:hypothetical protein